MLPATSNAALMRCLQLATIKAKSEALRLRQEFELRRFRDKYAAAGAADSAAVVATGVKGAGGGDGGEGGSGGGTPRSASSLSIDSQEAFDEPLRVRIMSS